MGAPDDELLGTVVSRLLGARMRIEVLQRLSGGASRETWSFDAVADSGSRTPLILRRDPGAHAGQSERGVEFDVLAVAHSAGVAAPEPLGLLRADDGLGSGFLMRRVEGETIPRRILRDDRYADARSLLTAQLAQQAARIHAVDTAELPELPVMGAREHVEQFRSTLDALGEAHPAFELGLCWLEEHSPPASATPRLVHGDFRNGNVIVGPEGLRAVLDWELAHLGDPVEDLGWLCVKSWRFGAAPRVGGFGGLDELLAAYEAGGGAPVDPEHVRYWEALGTLKWGIICEMQAFAHLQGLVRSVELAVLGRRVCEMEWDLLELVT
jgi:aminoglycoside phosphotransferase (APT) family kinase protein